MSMATDTVGELCTVVRRATPQDMEALAAMYATFEPRGGPLGLPPRGDARAWLKSLANDTNFLATAGDRVIGHAVLCVTGDSAELAVFVHQEFRGIHLGKRLLVELLAEARQKGLRRVWGMTEPDNLPMLRLAVSLGFVRGSDPALFTLDLNGRPRDPDTAMNSEVCRPCVTPR
jgi:L-amino acid N-acyltransferase YncA